MFYKPISKLLVLLLCLSLSTCNWFSKKDEPRPDLPPETQTGARTFGCYINGVPYRPLGFVGLTSNFSPVLVPNGGFRIGTYRINPSRSIDLGLSFGFANLSSIGIYEINSENGILRFHDLNTNCSYFTSRENCSYEGTITITKYDMVNFIVSGRFEATLFVPDCDTIRITEGRFDVKFN